MSIRSAYLVTTTGVGRKDYSVNIQTSVEPITRSHQARLSPGGWTTDNPLPVIPFPNFYALLLFFPDLHDVTNVYAPSDHRIMVYSVTVTGSDPTALTVCGLQKYSYPDYTLLGDVAIAFGIGGAEVRFTKGHVVIPGVVYAVPMSQWPGAPTFSVDVSVHCMEDRILG